MKSYTIQELAHHIDGTKYVLPFSPEVEDDVILQQVMTLFANPHIDFISSQTVNEYEEVEVNCLYHSYTELYPFKLVLKVFRYVYTKDSINYWVDDKEVQDRQWMVAMLVEASNSLLEELVDIVTIPDIIKFTKLKKVKYNLTNLNYNYHI
jgi:hypothetical protein